MSVTFMENFNFLGARNGDGTSAAATITDVKNIFKRRGGDFYNGGATLWNGGGPLTETEAAGLDTHNFLRMSAYYYQGNGNTQDLLGVPVNWANTFYLSMRIRITTPPGGATGMRYFVCTSNPGVMGNIYDLFNIWDNNTNWVLMAGYAVNVSGTPIILPVNEWVSIEVYRDSAGKITLWANDVILKSPSYTHSILPVSNAYYPYVYFGPKRIGSFLQTTGIYDVADLHVVDPTITPGPVYRLGSSARVATVPLAADLQTQWSIPAGATTTTHRDTIKPYRATQSALEAVDSVTIGARDQFSLGAVPKLSADATLVGAVQIERMASNTGGATHSISMEMDAGGGIKETAAVTLSAASGFVYGSEVLQLNSDGAGWTLANVPTTKVGFSVKS